MSVQAGLGAVIAFLGRHGVPNEVVEHERRKPAARGVEQRRRSACSAT
jgi:hypothetical protein